MIFAGRKVSCLYSLYPLPFYSFPFYLLQFYPPPHLPLLLLKHYLTPLIQLPAKTH